ncbi:MAG: hypothetical protein J6D37_06960 [Clostridia bacterium]|nr:hypothetical protein [Clostridia bacterium]
MDRLLKLLYEIKKVPGMYLGKPSLMYLHFYIEGYRHREYELTNVYPAFFPGFDEFIHERYGIRSTHGWASIITFFEGTDEKAFYQFYVLLEEFLKNHSQIQSG